MVFLIYTQDARGHTAPEGECVYIRQSTSACAIINTVCYISSTLKICATFKLTAQLAYIVTDADCDKY